MSTATTLDPITLPCPHCGAVNRLPAAKLADQPSCGRCHQGLFTGAPLAVDEAGFDRQLRTSGIPLVVDFWAPWCGPCRGFAPVFAQAAARLEPRARLLKVDTEAQPGLAGRYRIQSIPTLAVFRDGREVARQSGALPGPMFERWVTDALARAQRGPAP